MAAPSTPVEELVAEEPRLSEYLEDYLAGIPLRVLEMRIKGALGEELAKAFCNLFRPAAADVAAAPDELQGNLSERHGRLGDTSWPPAKLVTRAENLARPGYNSAVAHEYLDTDEVLQAKAALVAQMMRKARRCVVYCGAGLSTASGIGDYATNTGSESVISRAHAAAIGFKSPYALKPNFGHRAIAALARTGLIWRIVQQNHDALLQKTGVPQSLINEIHGCWFDPSNPVVKFDEALRADLFKDLCDVEEQVDMVLVLGSSLSGMNSDRIVHSCGRRAAAASATPEESQLGTAIVTLQRTPCDEGSSVRIFSTIDTFLDLLAAELDLTVPELVPQTGTVVEEYMPQGPDVDIFAVPYAVEDGVLMSESSATRQVLDLRVGSVLTVTQGIDRGQPAVVVGKHPEGHFKMNVQRTDSDAKRLVFLGKWWVEAAIAGKVPQLPLAPQGSSSQ